MIGDPRLTLHPQIRRALVLTASALFLQCAPKVRSEHASSGNRHGPVLPGDQVERIVAAGRPSLHLIRRSGDPKGAVALAVFPPGGSQASLQLAQLIQSRLETDQTQGRTELSVHSLGFVIASEVDSNEAGTAWVKKVHEALTQEISSKEAESVELRSFLKSAADRVDSPSPYRDCMGQLGAEGKAPLLKALATEARGDFQATLESLRKNSVGAGRVGLAAVGGSELLDAVAQAHDRDWVEGIPPDDSWSPERRIGVIDSAGGRELRIALRVNDAEAALAGIRALRQPNHPLHARLHVLDSNLSVESTEVALRPAGACAGITIRIASQGPQPTILSLSQAAIVAQEEMLATVGQTLIEDETNLALISPSGALEAVAVGAWTAVRSERTGLQTATIVEYRSPPEDSLSASELGATINETRAAWAKRNLPVASASEIGQRELWMLLASECGTAPESIDETGLRALAVHTLAAQFDGTRGVGLVPWVSPEGLGLLAHAPPLRGEDPQSQASRIARALATAFAGPPLDGRVVAAERSRQLDILGNDPADALITNILGGGHPSMVAPLGNEKTVATQSTADVERTRDDLVREPLRLALLQTTSSGQKEAARGALSAWLAPLLDHPSSCGRLVAEPAAPGLWEVETIDEHVQTGAVVGVWSPTTRPLGKATEFLLNRPNGYLKNSLLVSGLAASAEARWIGGSKFGGLVIRVGAEAHQLDQAVQQTRALLQRLAEGAVSDKDAALAQAEFSRQEELISRTGAGRLTRLWLKGTTLPSTDVPIDAAALRKLHRTLSEKNHRIVAVRRRK